MAFTDTQRKALTGKLRQRFVKTRAVNGTVLNYVTGWHAIAEANRIFGYDAWDRQTYDARCVWSERRHGNFACLYSAKVRVCVRAGPVTITREGLGTGYGHRDTEHGAHEIALKAAETDATKRALATFGNPFGLSLYEKGPNRPKDAPQALKAEPVSFALWDLKRGRRTFKTSDALVQAIAETIPTLTTVKEVYAFWEANLDALVGLKNVSGPSDPTPKLLEQLKARGRAVAPPKNEKKPNSAGASTDETVAPELALARPKERRKRDKQHLNFVARHPCLVCGRRPAQAHHLRFAQQRAMGLKVSDEYTVPLCAIHHDALHQTGDEPAWWARHGLDPLAVAERLWQVKDKSEGADLDPLIAARSRKRDLVQPANETAEG